MHLKSSTQTSSIDYIGKCPYKSKNIKHYTNSIYQKYNSKYMIPIIHQNNLGTKMLSSQILF